MNVQRVNVDTGTQQQSVASIADFVLLMMHFVPKQSKMSSNTHFNKPSDAQ